jgi:transposase
LIRDFLADTNITVLPQPPYSPDLAPADFFISQTEIRFERTTISDNSRDYGKFADRATRNPEKGVQGLFPEVMDQCRMGVI